MHAAQRKHQTKLALEPRKHLKGLQDLQRQGIKSSDRMKAETERGWSLRASLLRKIDHRANKH